MPSPHDLLRQAVAYENAREDGGRPFGAVQYGRILLMNHLMKHALPASLLITLLLAGCAGSQPAGQPAPDGASPGALAGTSWQLAAFGEAADNAPPLQEEATITFSEDGRFSGSAGCNRYFGNAEVEGDRLAFSQTGATRQACPPPVMAQEGAYLAALGAVAGWKRAEGRLARAFPWRPPSAGAAALPRNHHLTAKTQRQLCATIK